MWRKTSAASKLRHRERSEAIQGSNEWIASSLALLAMTRSRSSLLYGHVGQVLEPALGLHVAFDLGRHRPRVQVVADPDIRGIVDEHRVRLREQPRLLRRVEGAEQRVEGLVELGLAIEPPILSDPRRELRAEDTG